MLPLKKNIVAETKDFANFLISNCSPVQMILCLNMKKILLIMALDYAHRNVEDMEDDRDGITKRITL